MAYSLKTTHDKVRKRALNLVGVWTAEFEYDSSLGVMEECYSNLKAKSGISMLCFPLVADTCPKTISFSHQTSLHRLPPTMKHAGGRKRSFNAFLRCLCMTRVVEVGIPSTRRIQVVQVHRPLPREVVPVPATLQDPIIHQATCLHRVRRELLHRPLHPYHCNPALRSPP